MADQSIIDQFLQELDPQPKTIPSGLVQSPPVVTLARPLAGVALAFWLLILVIASLAFIIARFDTVQQERAAAYELSRGAAGLKGDLLDAETGQRGYVITRDEAFLQPFQEGMARVSGSFSELARKLAGQPELLAGLDRAATLWTGKVAEMQASIDAIRQGRNTEAVALVASGDGKKMMDAIRAELDIIHSQSAMQLDLAVADFEFWRWLLVAFGILALLAAILAAWWEIARTRRFMGASRAYQSGIVADNLSLEQMVDERTGSLGKLSGLLQAVLGATGEAIYAKDRQSRIIFANDSTLRIIGLSRDQVLGKADIEFYADRQQAETAMQNDRRVMDSGAREISEEVFSAGTSRRVFSSNKQPLRNHRGEVIGIVGVSTDITERKEAESALFVSEQRFRAAISAFDGIVWTADPEGGVTLANAAWTALTGQSVADAAGQGWSACIHPDDVEPTRAQWTACLASLEPFLGEYRVLAVDGSYHTFDVRAVPVRDASGKVIEWVGLNIDISAEREAQRLLQDAVERFNVALAAGNTGAWELRPENPQVIIADNRMLEIWDLPAGATLAQFVARIHPDDRPHVESEMALVLKEGATKQFDLEYRIFTSTRSVRWVAVKSKTLVTPDRKRRIIGTARDVSVRRQNEERINFLMRELSHRTKNSLAIVQAIARQTGARAANLAEFQAAFHQRLHGMAQSLNLVVQSDWQPVSIVDLIRSQTTHLGGEGNDRLLLSGPEIFLKTEAAQNIGLAVHELSTNAAKYGSLSTPAGKVRLEWGTSLDEAGQAVFTMVWEESGGPVVVPPEQTGFGHTVIHRVVNAALAGTSELKFPPEGVRWRLVVPATHVIFPRESSEAPVAAPSAAD